MSTTMVYKHPGKHQIHGDKFDYLVVADSHVEEALDDGWSLTTPEAKAKATKGGGIKAKKTVDAQAGSSHVVLRTKPKPKAPTE